MSDKRALAEEQHLLTYDTRPAQRPQSVFDSLLTVDGAEPEPGVSFTTYWHVLLRRRWIVISIAAVVTTLVAIASFKMKPVYQATARVQLDTDIPQMQSLDELYQQLPGDQDFLRTQIQVLQSENLAWRTVQRVGLVPPGPTADGIEQKKMQLIADFKSQLSVQLVPGTRVIQVAFESADRQMAAKAVNELIASYTEYNFREKYDATRQASERMEQQLDELKAKVEKSQRDLVEYQRQHSIVDVNDKQNVVEQRLAELSNQLTTAQSARIEKESLYNLQSTQGKAVPIGPNELLQRLEEKHAELKQQYVEALTQYGPSFPKVVRLEKQLDDSQSAIDKEWSRSADRIHSDYVAAIDRENLLRQAVEKQKIELGEFNKLLVQQNILKGEYDTNQQLYQRLLQHLKDALVSAGLKSSNSHLIDAALIPLDPVRPRKLRNVLLALLVGLGLGVCLAFVRESLDQSIKNPEELEVLVSMPTLAVIPAKRLLPRQTLQVGNGSPRVATNNGHLELPVLDQPNSPLAESFLALRTATLLSMAAHSPQVLLIASANRGEGKTTTAANLAMALAQQQGDVLLIDGDLRKQGLSHALKLDNRNGLSTILAGRSALGSSLQKYAPLPRLRVLTAGPLPPNPADLLSSSDMGGVLDELRGYFRHIVLDSPPLLVVTDGTVLSTLVDGVILVVESGVTLRKSVVRASKILQNARARRLGVVLNKVDLRFDGYYGDYSYGYYPSPTQPRS